MGDPLRVFDDFNSIYFKNPKSPDIAEIRDMIAAEDRKVQQVVVADYMLIRLSQLVPLLKEKGYNGLAQTLNEEIKRYFC